MTTLTVTVRVQRVQVSYATIELGQLPLCDVLGVISYLDVNGDADGVLDSVVWEVEEPSITIESIDDADGGHHWETVEDMFAALDVPAEGPSAH